MVTIMTADHCLCRSLTVLQTPQTTDCSLLSLPGSCEGWLSSICPAPQPPIHHRSRQVKDGWCCDSFSICSPPPPPGWNGAGRLPAWLMGRVFPTLRTCSHEPVIVLLNKRSTALLLYGRAGALICKGGDAQASLNTAPMGMSARVVLHWGWAMGIGFTDKRSAQVAEIVTLHSPTAWVLKVTV